MNKEELNKITSHLGEMVENGVLEDPVKSLVGDSPEVVGLQIAIRGSKSQVEIGFKTDKFMDDEDEDEDI